jgi:hypothetical protein
MYDRFDFEQDIMKCWNVTEDIDTLYQMVGDKLDGIDPVTQDILMNYLLGLKSIYDAKFEKLFDGFSFLVKEGKIR